MSVLAYGVAIWLILVGLYGIVTSRNLIHMVVSLSVVAAATDVLLVVVGYRHGGVAPIAIPAGATGVDPVVQAIASTDAVLTGVTVAMLLAVVVQLYKRTGSLDPESLRRMPADRDPLTVRSRRRPAPSEIGRAGPAAGRADDGASQPDGS
jgi:multicomponent Na+:H+ antiporter subunit C